MTPTEAAIASLREDAKRPNSRHAEELTLLLAQRDSYEKALLDVHEGATRQLAEPRDHADDQYALTAIASRVEEALRCE